jgi:dienelactone hydrolase
MDMVRATIAWLAGIMMFAGHAAAAIHTEEVEYRAGETALRGYLAYDDASPAKRPGVLVVHEWWGLNEHARHKAEALAKAGYVALAVDMYGDGKTTEHPQEAGEWSGYISQHQELGMARFLAGLKILKSQPLVAADQVAAIGYCFGGRVVLSMAVQGADLRAVASFHGAMPAESVAPGIPVKAKVLICHGGADSMVTMDKVQGFQEVLTAAGADWQFISYGGAQHSFTNPTADSRGIPGLAYDAAADRRSWRAMLDFFGEIFAE